MHGDELKPARVSFGDVPADEAQDGVAVLGEGDELAVLRVQQLWNLLPIIVPPLSVIVGEDGSADLLGQMLLEQWTERVDGQVCQRRQISGLSISNVHMGELLS